MFVSILVLYLCCVTSQGLKFFPSSFSHYFNQKIVLLKNLYNYTRDRKDVSCPFLLVSKTCFLVEGVFSQSDTWATGKHCMREDSLLIHMHGAGTGTGNGMGTI